MPTGLSNSKQGDFSLLLVGGSCPDVLGPIVQGLGHRMDIAASANRALESLGNGVPPDLILIEASLEDMNGMALCRRIKGLRGMGDVPVFICIEGPGQIEEAYASGAADYLLMPVRHEEFRARVSMAFELKGRARELYRTVTDAILLRESIEAISTGITIADMEGRILYTNPAEAGMHGYERSELVGRHVSLFAPKGQAPAQSTQPPPKEFKEWTRQRVNHKKDGTPFPVELKSVYIKDSSGKPVNVITITQDITDRIEAQKKLERYTTRLEEFTVELIKAEEELKNSNLETIFVLTRAAEFRDNDTADHIKRIGMFSRLLAEAMGEDEAFCETLLYASPMHDVGKIGIPDHILLKRGVLLPQEMSEMKEHTTLGARLLGASNSRILALARQIALAHHENYDGSGYPNAARGSEIPLGARITKLADIYDALRSFRPYKMAFTHDEAVRIILEGDGRTMPDHFDPAVLGAFERVAGSFERMYDTGEMLVK